MKLFALFTFVLAKEREVWNSKGQVAHYDSNERKVKLDFGESERGPKMCMQEKIPGKCNFWDTKFRRNSKVQLLL